LEDEVELANINDQVDVMLVVQEQPSEVIVSLATNMGKRWNMKALASSDMLVRDFYDCVVKDPPNPSTWSRFSADLTMWNSGQEIRLTRSLNETLGEFGFSSTSASQNLIAFAVAYDLTCVRDDDASGLYAVSHYAGGKAVRFIDFPSNVF